jgi:hypothetical protein
MRLLLPDTRVVRDVFCYCACGRPFESFERPRQLGTVMPYEAQYSRGSFPVRWDATQVWETVGMSDVVAVTPRQEAAIQRGEDVDSQLFPEARRRVELLATSPRPQELRSAAPSQLTTATRGRPDPRTEPSMSTQG